nr:exo-alpha-sialidase [Ktedonobacteraceae bacterium]
MRLGSHSQPPYSNIRVTDDSYAAHSETSLTQDPHNPLNLVGGAKFFPDVAHYRFNVGYAASLDGGCTWSKSRVLPGFDAETSSSDPVFAFGPHSKVYAATIFINKHTSDVSVSRDKDLTFSKPTTVFETRPEAVFSDKPSGQLYLAWSDKGTGDADVLLVTSKDKGKTWSAPLRVNDDPIHN